MKTKILYLSFIIAICFSCKKEVQEHVMVQSTSAENYLIPNKEDQFLGGIKMIPIQT